METEEIFHWILIFDTSNQWCGQRPCLGDYCELSCTNEPNFMSMSSAEGHENTFWTKYSEKIFKSKGLSFCNQMHLSVNVQLFGW